MRLEEKDMINIMKKVVMSHTEQKINFLLNLSFPLPIFFSFPFSASNIISSLLFFLSIPLLSAALLNLPSLFSQFSLGQVRSVQFSSVQFSSVQFSSVQFRSVQFSSVQFSSVQFSSVQFSSVQVSSV